MWRASRIDFLNAVAALVGVLLLGILQGILLAALISVLLLLGNVHAPHVAFLGRIPGTADTPTCSATRRTNGCSACWRSVRKHRCSTSMPIMCWPDAGPAGGDGSVETVICDLSASPRMDLAGARMLAALQEDLQARDIDLTVVNAHGRVRDLLRAEGLDRTIHGITRGTALEEALA